MVCVGGVYVGGRRAGSGEEVKGRGSGKGKGKGEAEGGEVMCTYVMHGPAKILILPKPPTPPLSSPPTRNV